MRLLRAYRRIWDLWQIRRSMHRLNQQMTVFQDRYGVPAVAVGKPKL